MHHHITIIDLYIAIIIASVVQFALHYLVSTFGTISILNRIKSLESIIGVHHNDLQQDEDDEDDVEEEEQVEEEVKEEEVQNDDTYDRYDNLRSYLQSFDRNDWNQALDKFNVAYDSDLIELALVLPHCNSIYHFKNKFSLPTKKISKEELKIVNNEYLELVWGDLEL